jgi:hypothetical protein
VKNKVKDAFNNISSIFASGNSLTTISGGAPLPPNSPVSQSGLNPSGASNARTNNGTQANYVHTHVKNYSSNRCTALRNGRSHELEKSKDATKKYNAMYWVQNGIAPVPTALKPLTIVTKAMGEPAGAGAAGILMGCDAVMDIANGGLAFAEDAS